MMPLCVHNYKNWTFGHAKTAIGHDYIMCWDKSFHKLGKFEHDPKWLGYDPDAVGEQK